MSARPWYPFYPADFYAKTRSLSMMERGAYVALLDDYYINATALPQHMPQLYRIAGAASQEEREAVDTVVARFFTLIDGQYRNKRADEEIAKQKQFSEKQSGKAKARWSNATALPVHMPEGMPNACLPQPQPHKDQKQGRSPKEELVWEDGLQFLTEGGTPEPQARSALGRMVKQHGVVAVSDAVCDAAVQNPVGNRVAYLQAVLKGTKRDAGSSDDLSHRMV